jgi:S-adenosylhomocysteine hydrolase
VLPSSFRGLSWVSVTANQGECEEEYYWRLHRVFSAQSAASCSVISE